MASPSLEDLFHAYHQSGDADAIAAAYDRVAIRLLIVARHLCGVSSQAEDVVRATFLRALEFDDLDASSPRLPWLLGILSDQVARCDSGREIDAVEFSAALDCAVADLPEQYRCAAVLRLYHGLEPADIALAIDTTHSAVWGQLTIGATSLGEMLPGSDATVLAVLCTSKHGLAATRQAVVDRVAELQTASAVTDRVSVTAWRALAVFTTLLVLTFIFTYDDVFGGSRPELPGEAVRSCGLTFPFPRTGEGSAALRVQIRRADGLLVEEQIASRRGATWFLRVSLPIGSYEIVGTTPDGYRAEGALDVRAGVGDAMYVIDR